MKTILNKLKAKKERLLKDVPSFKRVGYSKVTQSLKKGYCPIIFGLKSTGKTTILIQQMQHTDHSIYITFRDVYINRLDKVQFLELIEFLYDNNYRTIYLDEVQIYSSWSDIIVEIIDSFPDLKLVVTGSSSLNLELQETGLDRTQKIIIQTLSFGEYLNISGKVKSKATFEEFLGNGGFPKYALGNEDNFEIQRSEILDEIITNDIPAEFKNIDVSVLSRLIFYLAKLTNGEVNVSSLARKISPNILERDILRYIDILEKSKILRKIRRINPDGSHTKRIKFKVYLNPHIHLWLLDTKFNTLDSKAKGHIVEAYWLFWALSINSHSKTFYYIKNDKNQEIDFASLNHGIGDIPFKTLHEMKYTVSKKISLDLLKSINAINKIVWNIDGSSVDGIQGKNILDTNDKEI